MSRRKQHHAGITPMAWAYLNDCAVDDHPHGWEYSMLENNHLDCSTGYSTLDIWEKFQDEILTDWIRRHPGTRPWCWWKFDSGLPRVCRLDRPFEIIEDQKPRAVMMWLMWRSQDNTRMLTDEEREAMRGEFLLDQRAWLQERGLLHEGE